MILDEASIIRNAEESIPWKALHLPSTLVGGQREPKIIKTKRYERLYGDICRGADSDASGG